MIQRNKVHEKWEKNKSSHYFVIILLHFTITYVLEATAVESTQWNYYMMVCHSLFLPKSTFTSSTLIT